MREVRCIGCNTLCYKLETGSLVKKGSVALCGKCRGKLLSVAFYDDDKEKNEYGKRDWSNFDFPSALKDICKSAGL